MAGDDGLAVRIDEPMSRHTAWRTGGACDAWVVVHRAEALPAVVTDCRSVGWPWRVLGAGTRSVVRDGPVRGVVLRLGTDYARLEHLGDGRWNVGAAVPVPALVAATTDAGHGGLEALAAIPGSVGASLVWDDGWDGVVEVRFLLRGRERTGPHAEVRSGRRLVTGAILQLAPGDPVALQRRVARGIAASRPSSWVAAPRRGDARQLMRSVQLPLVRLRRVAIPDAAPEQLINLGGGSSADLALLHRSAVERVKKVRGVELAPRLKWIGKALAKQPQDAHVQEGER